ncbi:MAG TPA: hypothetical protein VGN91_29455 [Bosea sp. (in: a-proteobacteria)]|jgi:hypothetical protein|nr:hypothetical protein [Bosea sp. (in: a-proteobacteria)]
MKLKDVISAYRSMKPAELAIFSARVVASAVPFLGFVATLLEPAQAAAAKAGMERNAPDLSLRLFAIGGFDPVSGDAAGYNVSSMSDNGVGHVRVSFAVRSPDRDYLVKVDADGDVRAIVDRRDESGFDVKLIDNSTGRGVDAAFKFYILALSSS